jgi:hypothetical protein
MVFKNNFAKKCDKNIAGFLLKILKVSCRKINHYTGFSTSVSPKIGKNDEISDHNIDSRGRILWTVKKRLLAMVRIARFFVDKIYQKIVKYTKFTLNYPSAIKYNQLADMYY